MKQLKFLIFLLLATSCQFFDTEKISSDTLYQEKMKTIEWDQVDNYPAFPSCKEYAEKEEQKNCFETTLNNYVSSFIARKNLITASDINSVVQLEFTISRNGEIVDLQIAMDSILQQEIPSLKDWLTNSIDSLPALEPANKEAIPVATKFTLPVVIKSEKFTN